MTTLEHELLASLKETLVALKAHIKEEAAEMKVNEQDYCPCYETVVKQAEVVIQRATVVEAMTHIGDPS